MQQHFSARIRSVSTLKRLLGLTLALLPGFGCGVTRPDSPPAAVEYQNVRAGKPPLRCYIVQLDLVNRHDQPKWFILRHWGDKPLPESDRLVERPGDVFSFVPNVLSVRERSKVYDWEKQSSFGVLFLGGDHDFSAIRLPPRKTLHISDAGIDAWSPIHEFEVWEASDILVNDTTPLEQWIAARIPAPEGHYATLTDRNRAQTTANEIRRGSPGEGVDEIQSIKLTDIRRWTVPIAGIEKSSMNPRTE